MLEPFDDIYFMKRALQEAEIAFDKGEIPVGAVIVPKSDDRQSSQPYRNTK